MVPYWLYFKANACALEERYEDAARFARRAWTSNRDTPAILGRAR